MNQLGKVTQDKAQYGQVLKGLITQVRGFKQYKHLVMPWDTQFFTDFLASSSEKNVHLSLAEAQCVFAVAVRLPVPAVLSVSWSEFCQDHVVLLVFENVLKRWFVEEKT